MYVIIFLFSSIACAEEFWGPSTSGPFFTGTAEASQVGSLAIEPWYYGFIQKHTSTTNTITQSISLGLPWDMDLYVQEPLIIQGSQVGLGTTYVGLQKTLLWDADTTSFWARPALAIMVTANLPTGTFGVQSTYWSFQLIGHKRFKPFQLYWQVGNSPVSSLQTGTGQLYNYSMAFEHVLNSETGLGYLFELYGQTQAGNGGYSYLWFMPEIEYNIIKQKSDGFSMNMGTGIGLPVFFQNNFPATFIPMCTITINFDRPGDQSR